MLLVAGQTVYLTEFYLATTDFPPTDSFLQRDDQAKELLNLEMVREFKTHDQNDWKLRLTIG